MGVWEHCPQKILKFNSAICSFFPRFQDRDSSSIRCFSFIFLLHITHSSKVNCTLDKVNCTLCVRKHTILGPGLSNYVSKHDFCKNALSDFNETWVVSLCYGLLLRNVQFPHNVPGSFRTDFWAYSPSLSCLALQVWAIGLYGKSVKIVRDPFTIIIWPENFRHRIKSAGGGRFCAGVCTKPTHMRIIIIIIVSRYSNIRQIAPPAIHTDIR